MTLLLRQARSQQPQGAVAIPAGRAKNLLLSYSAPHIGSRSRNGGATLVGIDQPSYYTQGYGSAGGALVGADNVSVTGPIGLYGTAGDFKYHNLNEISFFSIVEIAGFTNSTECSVFRATGVNNGQGIAFDIFPSSKTIRPLIHTGGTSGWTVANDTVDSNMAAGVAWGFAMTYTSGRLTWYSGRIGSPPSQWSTATVTGGILDNISVNGPLYIGGMAFPGPGNVGSFPGKIHEISFWDREFLPIEIRELFVNPWQLFAPARVNWSFPPIITIYRPSSDVLATGWVPSTGSALWDMIDEVSPSDADYITSPIIAGSQGAAICGLSGTLVAGSYMVKIRANATTTGKQVKVSLLDGSNASQGDTGWVNVTASYAEYDTPVTTTGTATRVKMEVR